MAHPSRALRADGEFTRTRIIDTAGELVATQGFAKTASKEIAQRAGVDLASINYHFGGRDGLYQVLLAEAHRGLIALPQLSRLAGTPVPARDKLRALIEFLVARATQPQSWHARVLARELVSPSPHLRGPLEEELRPKFALVKRLLSEITAIPEDDPALVRCFLNIGAPCILLVVMGSEPPGPLKPLLNTSREDLVEHLHTFALAGLDAVSLQVRDARASAKPAARKRPRPRATRR